MNQIGHDIAFDGRRVFVKRTNRMYLTDRMILSAFKTSVVFALANMGASFIDGLVTGHYLGSAEMAAVGLASPFFTISSALCTCLGTGLVALCAHNLGSGDKDTLNGYFNTALWTMLAVSVVMMAIFLFGAEPIAAALGARGSDGALLKKTAAYIRGLAVGLPTFLLSGVTSQVMQMDGGGRLVKLSAVCCLAADAVFDILAIQLGWGLFGIGLATSISTVVKFCILFSHFFGRETGALRIKLMLPKLSYLLEMLHSGSDTLILSAINIAKPILLNALIISAGGSAALSVLSVYNNLNGFTAVICTGLASALSITVGTYYGEVNKRDIVRAAGFTQMLVLILYAPIILLLIVFSGQIARCYLPDLPNMWGMTRFALLCLSFCLIAYSMIFLRIRYLQTINRLRHARMLTFAANFAVVIACAYLSSLFFGAYGIIAANAVAAVVCILGILLVTQIRSRKILVTGADYLYLPEEFDSKYEACVEFFLKPSESIEAVATGIEDFCEKNASDTKTVLSLPVYARRILDLWSVTAACADGTLPNLYIRAEIRGNACRLILRDDGSAYKISGTALDDALTGAASDSYTVNRHRVLDFNSLILDMKG